jgi:hypothetical protein
MALTGQVRRGAATDLCEFMYRFVLGENQWRAMIFTVARTAI